MASSAWPADAGPRTTGRRRRAVSRAVPAADTAGAAPDRPTWPVRSGTVPALVDGFTARPETAPDLTAALPAGAAVALVPDRGAAPSAFPGPLAAPDAQDWLRSSGKTQLAAAFAESLWQSGAVDLLVWIEATSRASVLSGYAAATAAATGRDQASSCESVAAQFLSWLGETSRSWLVVLDDLAGAANLDGLWPAGPAGRVLVTSADATAVPSGVRVVPVGPFSVREAIGYLNGRLEADPDKRLGAIELARDMDFEPVALAQASTVIASSPLSCLEYRAHFVRRREQLAEAASARPSAAAVTWMFLFGRADQLSPDGSAKLLLALAALLDGHGIPQTVLAAPAAGEFLSGGGGVPASSERALHGAGTGRTADRRPEVGAADGPDQPGAAGGAAGRDARGHAGPGGASAARRAAPGVAGRGSARLACVRPAILRGDPPAGHRRPAVGRRLPSRAGAGRRQPGSRRPDGTRRGSLARPGHDRRPPPWPRAPGHDAGRPAAGRRLPRGWPRGRRHSVVPVGTRQPDPQARAGSSGRDRGTAPPGPRPRGGAPAAGRDHCP